MQPHDAPSHSVGALGGRAGIVRAITLSLLFLAVYFLWQWHGWGGSEHKTLIGDIFFVPLNGAAVVTAWLAAERCAPNLRLQRCWRLTSLALLSYLLGDVVQTYNEVVAHTRPFPSLADAGYLAFYPLMLAALMAFPSARRERRQRWTLILDCASVSLAAAVPIWYVSLGPTIVEGGQSALAMAVSVAYPLGDMVLLVGLAAVLLRAVAGGSRAPLIVLGAGLCGFVGTDLVYGWIALHGSYAGGDLVDCGWMLSLACFTVAGSAQPRMRTAIGTPVTESFRLRVSWLPYVGLAATLGFANVLEWHEGNVMVIVVFVSAAMLAVLVSARQLLVQADLLDVQRQLREAQADRAALLDRTLRQGEDERIRIAGELHDGPVQRLASLGYLLERAARLGQRGETDRTLALVDEALAELRGEIGGLRRVMSDLRPPALDESGLDNALRDHLAHLFGDTDVDAQMIGELGAGRLPAERETVLYRVAQEALLNVAKHADASRVRVELILGNGSLTLLVEDNGVGFSAVEAHGRRLQGHFGLIGMRERIELEGGDWAIESAPGNGTRIRAAVPVSALVPPQPVGRRGRRLEVPA